MDQREKVIDEVKRMNPNATNFHIVNLHPEFLDGALYVVGFDHDDQSWHNYVYADEAGFHLTKNEALLIAMVSKKYKRRNILEFLGGISGVIGLIITLAIVYIAIANPSAQIPQILSAALTTILGFYFGSQTTKR